MGNPNNKKKKKPPEVLLCPFPFQGHLTPMLQLASLLHSTANFSISLLQTPFNFPDPRTLPPEFNLLPLQLHFHCDFGGTTATIIRAANDLNERSRTALEELILPRRQLACVVYDPLWKYVGELADRMKIPTMAIRGTSPVYVHCLAVTLQLVHQRVLPIPESEVEVPIDPKQHPLRFKDLPLPPTEEIPKAFVDYQHRVMNAMKSSSAIIWNTTLELDTFALELLRQHFSVPFFSIGPLHKMAPPLTTNVLQEDTGCLSWLDKYPPNSVLYVSLGSLIRIEEIELMELAQGLVKSQQPFLWAVHPTLLSGGRNAIDSSLPEDFKDVITRGKGCLVEWAPQKRVLAHPAVGGFLTHCGWNSILESMCEGVPLICRPCLADQMVNARYVSHVWKVGVELENAKASGIEKGIRKLIVSEEGKGIRHEAHRMKRELEDSINGGSSCKSLDQMVEFIFSHGKK